MAEDCSLLYLPEALEEDILVRLPDKSIARFESVCKRWHSLFRSKAFSELYFGSGHHQVSMPTKKDLRLIYPELRQRRRRHKGSGTTLAIGPLSNGIYALTSVLTPSRRDHVFLHTLKIGLFNPATRRMKFAPPFPDEYLPLLTGISSHKCNVSCGIDDDYRVVVLINYDNYNRKRLVGTRHCFLVFLYTWRTGKWERLVDCNNRHKRIGLPPPPATNAFQGTMEVLDNKLACSQKLFNGCWHWMTAEYGTGIDVEFGVLSFDFEAKSLALIPGPRCKATHNADVFVLQDHLAAIVLNVYPPRCEIWMKTTDPETTWTNVYRIIVVPDWNCLDIILHEVDYDQVKESELIRIKRIVLINMKWSERYTFDEKGDLLLEDIELSKEISLSVGGISKFTPTLEPLP